MLVLLDIGPFSLDFGILISFILGTSFGLLLFFLLYIYAVIRGLNKNSKFRSADETDIDEEEIKWLIKDAQEQFKNKDLRTQNGMYNHLSHILQELSVDISKKFYPNSKYPYLELTIDESLKLSHYITDRLDELLKGKILALTRGFTYSKIREMTELKTKVDQSVIGKAAKQYSTFSKAAMATLNAVNPVYWVRKFTKDVMLNIVVVRIGLALIAITGEETYKIYSKKVFNVEKTIDTGIEDLYQMIKEDVKKEGESS
ncbi:MAG: hypothetical protein AB7E61_04990 [Acholeplasmataceae bacterium]